jgi:hypothetical protein
VRSGKPGEPLRIVARVSGAAEIASVRVHYRHVTQYEDYTVLELKPSGQTGEYAATIPGEAISPQWDFMYYLDTIDGNGAGTMWPDAMREMPYVIVRTER